nr:MAG TPA: hypothetical protein [Caudoviricetes sp.]
MTLHAKNRSAKPFLRFSLEKVHHKFSAVG